MLIEGRILNFSRTSCGSSTFPPGGCLRASGPDRGPRGHSPTRPVHTGRSARPVLRLERRAIRLPQGVGRGGEASGVGAPVARPIFSRGTTTSEKKMTVRASTAATAWGARAVLLAMLVAVVAFQLTGAVASLELMPGEPQPDAAPRYPRRAPGRSLQHLQGTTGSLVNCPAGSAVTHTSDGACVDCLAGTYASGRTAVCIFPDMPLSSDPSVACSTKFNPTEFASKYSAILDPVYGGNTALNTMAAQCDFGKDAAALISGDEGYCSFADIGFTYCVPSASVDADGAVTFEMACDLDDTDFEQFQQCTDLGLKTGTRIECVWEGIQENCTACPPGSLCDAPSMTDPEPCPHGYECPDGATMTPCPVGLYADGGFSQCLNCPNGSICAMEGTGIPEKCPKRYFSGAGATACEGCWAGYSCATEGTPWPVICPAGYKSSALADACTPCAAGNSSDQGSEECYVCPAGTACATEATPAPVVCAAGTYATAGSTTCADCELGQYQPAQRSDSCLECPAGTRCPVRSISTLVNFQCPAGTYSRYDLVADAFTRTPYDHEDATRFPTLAATGDTRCNACPDGYRCPSPELPPVLCPAGTTRIGAVYDTCVDCPAGSSCATPNVLPEPCPAGSYATGGAAACTSCQPGFRCPATDEALQVRCESGTYAVAGMPNCTACLAGQACPNQDGTGIHDCDPGYFAEEGQVQCTPCPPGFECPSLVDPAAMAPCPKGTFSPGMLPACEACPKGFFNPRNGSASASACEACPRGWYSNFTAATSNATCSACPADTYCPLLGNDLPTPCPDGLSTFGRLARTSIEDCTMPPPPPPPPSPPPLPSSPPPPPTPPALAPDADATPTMTLRIDGTPATFDRDAFTAGVAAAVGGGATADDVIVEDVRSGSVVVDFYVNTPALFPAPLGGTWDVAEVTRVIVALDAAIAGGTLNVGAGVAVLSAAVESTCPPGTRVISTLPGGAKTCEACPAGRFSAATNAETCEPCAVGYAAGSRGMTACEVCVAGTVASTTGTDVCAPCPAGTIQPLAGEGTCEPCEDFFFAAADGSTACEPCPAGHLSGPTAWVAETPRMRADGRLSDVVGGAVNRSGCIPNATTWLFVPDPPAEFSNELTATHLWIAAGTFLATAAFMCYVGHGHWQQQKLLLKYAGGDSFYQAMIPEDEDLDRRGFDPRTEKADVAGVSEAIKAGNLDDAQLVVERILERDPDQAETLHAKAVVHAIYGELEPAKELTLRALSARRKPQFSNTLGVIHAREGELEKAAGEFELAIRRDPTLAVAYQNLGNVRMRQDDLEGAKEALTTALDKEPEYYKAMYNLALVSVKMGRILDAKHWFKTSATVKQRALDSHFNLGMIYLREGNVAESEASFNRCLAVNAKHAPSMVKLGNLQMMRGHPKRAVEQYLLALEIDPDSVEAIANIGVVEWSKGHQIEAEQHFLLALKFERKYYPALYNMGLLCMEQGRAEEAADWYRRAASTRPTSKSALFQLGTALRQLGQLEGQTPREEEKTAAEKALAASEAEREAEEAAAKLQEEVAASLRDAKKSSAAEAFADERRWSRLVLVSSKVRGTDLLVRCASPKVGVVVYDHRASTLGSLLRQCRKKISTNAGVRRVDSVAIVAPSKEGKVSLVKGVGLTRESLLDADVSAFIEGLTSMINLDVNAYRDGSRLDFLLLDATKSANDALVAEIKTACGLQTVTASVAMARYESYLLTEEQIRAAPTAAGARSVALYFDLKKLKPWSRLPTAPLHHPLPPEETASDPVIRREKTAEEEAADNSAVLIAANATKKLKSVGRAYAAYFRRRAHAGGDVTGGETRVPDAEETTVADPDGDVPETTTRDYGLEREREELALTGEAARALSGVHAPASAVLGAAGSAAASSRAASSRGGGAKAFKKAVGSVRAVARAGATVREPRRVAVDVLIEMAPEAFKDSNTQEYFAREMASELGIHPGRVRVRAFDASTSAATLTFDDAPGDVPLDVAVSTLQVKLSSDTLLVDPAFGQILLTEVRWPEGWGEGKEKNSGVGGGVARSREHARRDEEEEGEEDEEDAGEAAGGVAGGVFSGFEGLGSDAPRRLVLVSSRVLFADVLMESVASGVAAVYFDWRFSSLEKIAYECKAKCGGEAGLGTLRSIGIMTHHKPGAIGLVKGFRATRRNLVKSELRQFWVSLARLLAADGRVDVLSYDASRCVPTRRLLEEIGDLIRVPVHTCDAAEVTLGGDPATGGVDAAVLEDEEAFDAGSLYFNARRFAAWAASAPEKFTTGTNKYRGRAAAKLGGGSRAGGGSAPAVVERARGSGLRPTARGLSDPDADERADEYADEYAFDPELDPELAAENRASRLAASREREETRRKLALMRNPADLLREVTAAGASGGGVSRVDAGGLRRQPRPVPIIPTEKLAAARDAATGYDPRLDRYAAERAADAKKIADQLAVEEARSRREAQLDDLSLVPNLELAARRVGGGPARGGRDALATLAEANFDPPVNARDAARRAGGLKAAGRDDGGDDDASADRRREAIRWADEGGGNDAPPEQGVVGMLDLDDPSAPKSRPRWEMDENLRRLRRYENTGIWNAERDAR